LQCTNVTNDRPFDRCDVIWDGNPGGIIKQAQITTLAENTVELEAKRKAFAKSHSWENNAKEIYKAINTIK